MIFWCGGIWELTWWEIITFTILFGINVFLIINAPSSLDETKEQTSYKSASNEDYYESPILHD